MTIPLGYLMGCPLYSFMLDKIGRKRCLLLLAIPQILAWVLIATANCVSMLYAARLLAGISEGALYTSLPVYLCEISEPKIRGVLVTTLSGGIILGILLINCYGSYLSIRCTALVSIALPILFLLTFAWMPESPYYFLMKKNSTDAKRSLKFLRRMRNVDEELNKLTEDVKRQTSDPGRLRDLFTIRSNLKALLIVVGLRSLQQFSGISAFGVYTQVIFQQADGQITPAESAIIYGITQVTVTCFGSILNDYFGRKPMVLASTITTAICLFIEGLYFYFQYTNYNLIFFKWVPIAGMILYIIVFSIGLGVAPNLMMGELFPANVKAKALAVINVYFALCMCASFKLFQEFEHSYGMYLPFFFFGVCCIAGIPFAYFCIPETKGRTLEEIQEILRASCDEHKIKNVSEEFDEQKF